MTVNANATYRTKPDTPHSLSDVNVQLFCTSKPTAASPVNNLGFVDAFTRRHDLTTGRHIMDLLLDVRRVRESTLILVTHDAELASLADSKLVLRDGRPVEAPAEALP